MDFMQMVEKLFHPSPLIFVVGTLIVLLVPVAIHFLLVASSPYTVPPAVLLVGPSNAGKTALLTLLERGDAPTATHTSQTPQSVEFTAPSSLKARNEHRAKDDTDGTHTKFLLVDTPGHGKLRHHALSRLTLEGSAGTTHGDYKTRAILFVVDAAALGENEVLAPTAEYLYDVLLALQRRMGAGKTSRAPPTVYFAIAANKMDLFTALPATVVRSHLEAELSRIRASRSRGLLDSGVGVDEVGSEERDEWLGAYGSEKFSFGQMMEFDIEVDVMGGNVVGEGPGVNKWWTWMIDRI